MRYGKIMPLSFESLSLGPPNNRHKEKDDREAVKDNVVVVDEGEGMKQIGKNVFGMPHLLGGMWNDHVYLQEV